MSSRFLSFSILITLAACTTPTGKPLERRWVTALPEPPYCQSVQLAAIGEEALVAVPGGRSFEPCDVAPTTLLRVGAIGVRWAVPFAGPASVVVAPDQTIYAAIGGADAVTLHHLDAGGKELSSVPVQAPPSSGALVLAMGDDGDLYLTRSPFTLRMHADASVVWTRSSESARHAFISGDRFVIGDSVVSGAGFGGTALAQSWMSVLDGATGAFVWSRMEGPTQLGDEGTAFAPCSDLMGAPDGTIFFATGSDARSLDRHGNDRWRRNDRHATTLAMLPSGHLAIGYVTAEDSGGIELVDPATGNSPADASDGSQIVPLGFPGLPDRLAATAGGDLLVADPWTVSAWREVP